MTDAEYIFKSTSAERKRNGYGDHNKKRQGGRIVRLPSDHMTAKQLKERSGPCMTYNMNAPVGWPEFKTWPADIQREYLQKLKDTYGASAAPIGEMMGIGKQTIVNLQHSLGICGIQGKHCPLDKQGWAAFIGANELAPEILVESSPVVEEKVELPEKKEEKPEPIKIDNSDIMNIAILLDALKGSGAKLTIEVTL